MAKKPILTIVSSVHNEVDIIEDFIHNYYTEIMVKIPSQMMIVEDGSTDGTKELLVRLKRKYPLILIMKKEKQGLPKALAFALKEVTTPLIFYSDPDQYNPKDFWKLYEKVNHYDHIIGKKVNRKDPLHRKFIGWVHCQIVKHMFRLPVSDVDCGFRIIKRKIILDILPSMGTIKHTFFTELTVRAHHKGYSVTEVPISHRLRDEGTGSTRTFYLGKLPRIITRQFSDLIKLKHKLVSEGQFR